MSYFAKISPECAWSLPTDAAVLVAFREGRPDALERVYREHEQAVAAHLRKLAHASGRRAFSQSSALADLVQEVFVRAFSPEARSSYDGIRDYLPYLLAIAR